MSERLQTGDVELNQNCWHNKILTILLGTVGGAFLAIRTF